MSAPVVFRSTDASAPTLTGQVGSLITLLDALLVGTGGVAYGSKASLGWTKVFSGTNTASYKQGLPSAGVPPTQFHMDIDDNGGIATAGAREAKVRLYRTMTAVATGTDAVPAAGSTTDAIRKSNTADGTARTWLAIGDETTFYLFVLTGDVASIYQTFSFGEFYSYVPGDLYKNLIFTRAENTSTSLQGIAALSSINTNSVIPVALTGWKSARSWAGAAVNADLTKTSGIPWIWSSAGSGVSSPSGCMSFTYPNPADGGTLISPMYIWTAPAGSMATIGGLHGQMRGVYVLGHASTNFTDGDTVSGSGDYAGRTFLVVKGIETPATVVSGLVPTILVETTAWARSV